MSEDNTEIFASQFLTYTNIPIVLMNSIYDIFKIFITYFRLAFRLIMVNRKIMLERTLRLGVSHILCLEILIFRRIRYCYYIVTIGFPPRGCRIIIYVILSSVWCSVELSLRLLALPFRGC